MTPSSIRKAAVSGLAFVLASPLVVFAHTDDPKEKDRMPPYEGPGYRAAEGGVASLEDFAADGVILLSWLPLNELGGGSSGNDCWGYVAPSGREYALIGTSTGTAFVEVTDPSNAQLVVAMPGPTSTWRDVKAYGQYAYSVSEGGAGIQVFDLSAIDQGTVTEVGTVLSGGTSATHNVSINEESGYLYRCGGGSNGIRIYSLANPANPTLVGSWLDKYVHDCQVVNYTEGPYAGREIAFCAAGFNVGWVQTGLTILDVTDKQNIFVVASYEYPNGAYSHQGWLSADRQYFFLNDEADETTYGVTTTTHVIDVSVLENPEQVSTFTSGLASVDHNLYTKGDTIYEANYRSGLRIFDATNPLAPVEIAYFDTFPGSDSANYNGMWSTFPFFPSGTVVCSDLERGLFVLYVGEAPLAFSYPDGLPGIVAPTGQTVRVAITPIDGQSVVPGTARLNVTAQGNATTVPLVEVEPGIYEGTFPDGECGTAVSYSFTATASNGITLSAPNVAVEATVAVGVDLAFVDDMEANAGWVVGSPSDTATSGTWVLVDPIGTIAQPEDDHTADPGVMCWVTGQGFEGGSDGAADVDNGATTLTSPALDASGVGEPFIEYYRWFSNNLGANPGSDSMSVLLSNDDGQTWASLEEVYESTGVWTRKSFRIADVLPPTAQMRLRFIARDTGGGSLVEAGVDDVSIVVYTCEAPLVGDLDGNGVVDGADLGALLGAWGGKGAADLNGDGTVDGADLGILLANWGNG
ncbi:MAG: choice-of-anchor B family protein [Phycisphaerales bacterium]|nr:choice-of-anchor B family protein [Phycisphaerales bacterium]